MTITTNSNSISICALILAGGQGRRMGYKDKGQIKLNGTRLIETIISQLEKQSLDELDSLNTEKLSLVISTNTPENYQEFGYLCIDDSPFPSEGPLCAIAAGMLKIECDYLLLVPCDCPSIPNNLVSMLWKALQGESFLKSELSKEQNKNKSNRDVKIASIRSSIGIEPLFSLIRIKDDLTNASSLTKRLVGKVEQGLRKTQNWITSEKHIFVEDLRENYYKNINKPEDLELFQDE